MKFRPPLLSTVAEPDDLCECGHTAAQHSQPLPSHCESGCLDCISFRPMSPRVIERARASLATSISGQGR